MPLEPHSFEAIEVSMRKAVFQVLFLPLLVVSLLSDGTMAQTFGTSRGHAEFTGSATLHSFTGTSNRLSGQIDLSTGAVEFNLPLNTLDTGNNDRDHDMMETLEVERFPDATFSGRLLSEFDTELAGRQTARVRGTFTVHGVSREITVTGSLENHQGGVRMSAAWELSLDDYNLDPPGVLIIRVRDEMEIRISGMLVRR